LELNPLKDSYHEAIIKDPARFESCGEGRSALLCIDMQYLDAARGYGVFADIERAGAPNESMDYYFDRLERVVLPNVRRLQDGFRRNGIEVIHIRIQSLTQDGRDRGLGHKRLALLAPPGSKEAEFLEEVAPVGDEIVINKTASGVFNSTNLHYVLRNLDIDSLFVTGVYTDECVSTTVRDACDLGFHVTLVPDACATVTQRLHDFTVATLRDRYARCIDTDGVLREVERYMQAV
jgi:nicotinamidase-related amidase